MKRYRDLFFDLDHTLWDFEGNSRAVLRELHAELGLLEHGIDADGFLEVYEEVNAQLWGKMESGAIDKGVLRVLRFRNSLLHFGLKDDRLARTMGEEYLLRCPERSGLNPGAGELLRDLQGHYRMHIITNGFHEVQLRKLVASSIKEHFEVIVSSEQAGAAKPSARIFQHALRAAGATAEASMMIGDNAVADVRGAREAGLDQVHYAPAGKADPEATFTIDHFDGLRRILLH